jgi:hypothetical protein
LWQQRHCCFFPFQPPHRQPTSTQHPTSLLLLLYRIASLVRLNIMSNELATIISKLLGYGIILGSLILKVPQISTVRTKHPSDVLLLR